MLVKSVDSSPSYLAWCPISGKGHLLAAATREGTVDENFQSHNCLEILDTTFTSGRPGIPSVGRIQSEQAFTALAWGHAEDRQTYPSGIIVGGMNDGSLTIWDPSKLIDSGAGLPAKIHCIDRMHSEPVTSLDFNSQMPKYLASGSMDGKVFIWDLKNPVSPLNNQPPDFQSSGRPVSVTAVAWNRSVQYILASSNERGETSIWDLKNKRLAVTFRSNSRAAVTSVAWNPVNARQLIVSYAGKAPAEIWDLRQYISPKAYLEGGHQRSILDVSWCPHDPNMLLTTGDDNQAILWDDQGHLTYQLPFEDKSNFIVEWSPQKPGVLATCSFSGQIGIHSIQYCGEKHVPKWTKRAAGASFGFGGRYVSFNNEVKSQTPNPISLFKLESNPEVGANAEELASILTSKDVSTLRSFAEKKVDEAATDAEKTTWELINLFYSDQHKDDLFDYFGFKKQKMSKQASSSKKTPVRQKKIQEEEDVDHDAFFSNLGSSNDLTNMVAEASKEEPTSPEPGTNKVASLNGPVGVDMGDVNPKVRHALVTKNFELAVELSLQAGRIAEALVFAQHGGPELWEDTCSKFLSHHQDGFISNLFEPVTKKDFGSMVDKSNTEDWKQTLCMILSYASSQEEANEYLTRLGKKLLNSGELLPSMACFMCANDLERLFGCWGDLMAETRGEYHPMMEKIFSISNAPNIKMGAVEQKAVAKSYGQYANFLVAEGQIEVAAQFLLQTKKSIDSKEVNDLLERIGRAYPHLNLPIPGLKQGYGNPGRSSRPGRDNRTGRVPPGPGPRAGGARPGPSRPNPAAATHNPRPGRPGPGPRQPSRPSRPSRNPAPQPDAAPTGRPRPVPRNATPNARQPTRPPRPGRGDSGRPERNQTQPRYNPDTTSSSSRPRPGRPNPRAGSNPARNPEPAPARRAPPARGNRGTPPRREEASVGPPMGARGHDRGDPTRPRPPGRQPVRAAPRRPASNARQPMPSPSTSEPAPNPRAAARDMRQGTGKALSSFPPEMNAHSRSRRPPPRGGRTPTRSNDAYNQPREADPRASRRAPARRGGARNPRGTPPAARQPEPMQPAPQPSYEKKAGGFFGQNSSARDYTGEKGNDDRDVITTLTEVLNTVEDSKKVSKMQLRQVRATRTKITHIQGLLSTRQLSPASYASLADVADALQNFNCNQAMEIIASTERDRSQKLAARNWLPHMKILIQLVRTSKM